MVSVVIALYNGEKFIKETIESALLQTVDTEVIVVDDCSNDQSVVIVEEIEKKSDRVHLIKNTINSGFCKTANLGVRNACGDYILVLGQDDVLKEKHCEKMLKYFTNEVVAVYCDYELIDENGTVFDTSSHCVQRDLSIKDFYKYNAMPSPGLLIKKGTFESINGYFIDDRYPNYGEYYVWIKLAQKGKIKFCKEIKALYRRHSSNITNSFTDKKIMKKIYGYQIECRKLLLSDNNIKFLDKVNIAFYSIKDYLRRLV